MFLPPGSLPWKTPGSLPQPKLLILLWVPQHLRASISALSLSVLPWDCEVLKVTGPGT